MKFGTLLFLLIGSLFVSGAAGAITDSDAIGAMTFGACLFAVGLLYEFRN